MQKEKSCLLLVDVQEKLTPRVQNHEILLKQCAWLIRLAHAVNVPLVVSEQYSQGLGKTVASLSSLLKQDANCDKVYFSCCRDELFKHYWQNINKTQVIIMGIETHVCVLQTVMDLLMLDAEVFVVVNAVSSRHPLDHQYGLKRMKQAGAQLVTTEMVFFEWVESAGTPEFKALSKAFLRDA